MLRRSTKGDAEEYHVSAIPLLIFKSDERHLSIGMKTSVKGGTPMTAKNFSLLAAVIFAIVAILQLARALSGAPIIVGTTFPVPVWASWIACIIAAALAWIGFRASRPGR